MSNKTHSQSNEETEDGEQEDGELNVKSILGQNIPIVDVWDYNFQSQLKQLSLLSQTYNIIALDTEFPGNCIKKQTLTPYYKSQQIDYQHIWHNVQKTKLIQIGFTLSDSQGNLPVFHSTWQFHFRFDLLAQNSVTESIQLLRNAGINFEKLKKDGISLKRFSQKIMESGLILNKNIKWVVFHGCYDFAYLLKQLRGQPLPKSPQDFYKSIKIYFPNIYDLKHIVKDEDQLRNEGLDTISFRIGCARVGPKHQAGSDSLLTIRTYFQLKKYLGDIHFQDKSSVIYGIMYSNSEIQKQHQLGFTQYHQNFTYQPINPSFTQNSTYYGPLYQYMQFSRTFQNSYSWQNHYGPH